MSAIDQYIFTCIGIIELPLTYLPLDLDEDEEFDWMSVAIYRLEQDIPEDEAEFQGKTGDILVGGGSGEAAAMRILMPEAIVETTDFDRFYDDEEYSNLLDGVTYPGLYDVYQFFWTPDEAYKYGSGYVTLGWDPDDFRLGRWLTEHIVSFVLKHYPQDYAHLKGDDELDCDGSICNTLSAEDDRIWNWRKYREDTPIVPQLDENGEPRRIYRPLEKHRPRHLDEAPPSEDD